MYYGMRRPHRASVRLTDATASPTLLSRRILVRIRWIQHVRRCRCRRSSLSKTVPILRSKVVARGGRAVRDHVERRRIHSHAEFAEGSHQRLASNPRRAEQRNGDGHVLCAVERSDPIVRGVGRVRRFQRGPLEDVFKRRNQSASPSPAPRRAMNASIGGSSARRLRRVNFFRRLSHESLRIHPRRWK